jgi:MtrB/PioB family decaheme-associated outer membrane protein
MNGNAIGTLGRCTSAALLTMAILSLPVRAGADETPAVDTSRWTCKYCPFDEGFSASVELGPGWVSDDSFKFGEYTGLNKQGGFAVANAEARYRKRDGTWYDLTLTDLGLDSRSLSAAGGKQGTYKLFLSYKELPHYITGTALSPFLGIGTGSLTLPAGWVAAGSTGTMPSLAASLHGVDLETRRRAVDFGAALTPVVHWEFAVKFRHEEKTGTLGTAGAFEFNSSRLAMPVDYDTNQIDASAAYSGSRFQARFAYYGSIFKNNEDTLTWANPYLPLVAGATAGQLALAPSNKFHQLVASAAFAFDKRTHATADIAVGRMTQDEAFLPYTLNPDLSTTPLPRGSLDGRVNTLTGHLRITSAITDKLRLGGTFTYDDRDNRTPQSVYDWVTTDTALALPRTNLPYSSTHSVAKMDGGYALTRDLRLDAGYIHDEFKRDLQEVDRTRENTYWGKVTARVNDRTDISLKGSHGERSMSDYNVVAEIVPPENPLLRKYNMADRDRDTAELRVDVALTSRIGLGLAGSFAWDNYTKSVLGLLDGRDSTVTLDASVALSDDTSATFYLNHEQIKSDQANAELLASAPTWFANNNDSIDTGGFGLKHRASEKLDLGANYTVSRSTGQITIVGRTPAFPDLKSRLDSVKLYAAYRVQKRLSLRLAYWFENYHAEDWTLDGVTPTTISNVLAFGQGSPSYHISVVTLSGRYEF